MSIHYFLPLRCNKTKYVIIPMRVREEEREKTGQIWGRGGFNIGAKDVLPNLRKKGVDGEQHFPVILYTILELEVH